MDIIGIGFYLVIALITNILFHSKSKLLAVSLTLLFSAMAVGLLALISTHQFDFFSRQNMSEMLVGNAAAAILSIGVAWLVRLVRSRTSEK